MKRTLALAALLAASTAAAPAHAGLISGLVQHVTAKKGDRLFHEKGSAFHGTFTAPDGTKLPAQIRLSRGRPSAPGKPEILGVAVKVQTPKGAQDFLMVTAQGEKGLKARLPATKAHLAGETVTSIFSTFRMGTTRGPISAYMPSEMKTPLDGSGVAQGQHSFDLMMRDTTLSGKIGQAAAYALFGPWGGIPPLQLGKVTMDMDRPLSLAENVALKFDPTRNMALDVKAVGLTNAIRHAAYPASQAGRAAADWAREAAKKANGTL